MTLPSADNLNELYTSNTDLPAVVFLVRKNVVPSHSSLPAAAEVKSDPEVKFSGATDVVPAAVVKLVSVPKLVMLGCAAVATVPATATLRLATCVVDDTVNGAVPVATLDMSVDAVTEPAVRRLPPVILPLDVSVAPTEVMFGWAASTTVLAVVAMLVFFHIAVLPS